MRISFRAMDGSFVANEDALACGFSGPDASGAEHYLTLQRSPEDEKPSEDWGVYVEFDDQINSAYGRVRRCRLTRQSLSLDLSEQLGHLEGVEGFDVTLKGDDAWYRQIGAGLGRIFRGMPNTLEIA